MSLHLRQNHDTEDTLAPMECYKFTPRT